MKQRWAIFRWTLWQRRWFILWWCVAITALIALNLSFYPTFRDQAAQLEQSLKEIPDSAKALSTDTGEFASPVGFLSSQVFYLMLPMLLGIMSIALGSSLIAREEKEGTIELLLSRPISRTWLLIAKAKAGLVLCAVGGLVAFIVTAGLSKLVDLPVSAPNIAVATLTCTLLALTFGSVAFLIAATGKARIASIGIATVVALGGYIIASLAGLATWLKTISKIFPFYYYKPGEILYGNYNWQNVTILTCGTLVACTLAWIAFRRRDI